MTPNPDRLHPVGCDHSCGCEALAPTDELVSRLHFDAREGRIWLNDQRMLLMHNSAMGVLRQELIEGLGLDKARGLITRMGYNCGAHDADLAQKFRRFDRPIDAVYIGPQLHMLEGVARVEKVNLELDEEAGHFLGEFNWHGSAEAEAHVQIYGIGSHAVCWQQAGYASGFVSRFMGRPVVFREIQCRAQGAPHCVIVGRPAEAWAQVGAEGAEGAALDLASLRADDLSLGVAVPTPMPAPGQVAGSGALLNDLEVVGVSAGFNAVCHMVRRAANTQATVLFLGESGVGKEVLAQALHRISPRSAGPFVAINCAAIPEDLIESELFGVDKGGYTGALATRPGRFERAHGGTLFLDEIGILGATAQGKLLRALQEREIERVGGTQTVKVDVRVVAATNLDLKGEVEAGRFREDLYYRLNVLPVRVPPLRERREDIPVFMNHFLHKFNRRDGRSVTGFTGRAIDAMLAYAWPGNIRELENLVERGVVLASDGGAIDLMHLFLGDEGLCAQWLALQRDGSLRHRGVGAANDPVQAEPDAAPLTPAGADSPAVAATPAQQLAHRVQALLCGQATETPDARLSLDQLETELVRSAMTATGGNQSAAARLLGLSRAQLIYRLKGLG
ncbi:MAG TPA: sigma 54-interacting transcriptional regulator [Burkholderiaceae bacterium]|nr:sigma 54-interacting transcriptional regulator [Burkholderiaceae bacterium]HMY98628.1 sigma 54-interacting transcriptional regulator [Burkholderiaceae bacterium]HNB44683.1 sigma 54-interacting transcriptional regulator [Burkholderiaceae bacterium]HNG81895.1 sigma 54-interacting transcriptional regulator [Burkholderiaceae bacterium]